MHAHEKKAIFIVIGTSKSQRYRVTNGSASEARLHQTKTLRTRHCISYMLEPLIIMYRFQLHVVRQVSMCPGGSVCWDTRHVLWQGTTNPASLYCDTECWQEINKKKIQDSPQAVKGYCTGCDAWRSPSSSAGDAVDTWDSRGCVWAAQRYCDCAPVCSIAPQSAAATPAPRPPAACEDWTTEGGRDTSVEGT